MDFERKFFFDYTKIQRGHTYWTCTVLPGVNRRSRESLQGFQCRHMITLTYYLFFLKSLKLFLAETIFRGTGCAEIEGEI